jgi:hypothetical protein
MASPDAWAAAGLHSVHLARSGSLPQLLQGLMDEARHFVLPPRRQGRRFPREVKRSCRSKYPPKKSQSGLKATLKKSPLLLQPG